MYYTQPPKMLETKIVYWLFNILGIPALLLGTLANIDNWKSVVLFFLAAILTALKIIVYVIEKRQSIRDKDLEYKRRFWEFARDKDRKN